MFLAPFLPRPFTLDGSLVRVLGFGRQVGVLSHHGGRGPLPKVAGERQRRNRRARVELVPQGEAPPVPQGIRWLAGTVEAWAAYWSSPVSQAVDCRTGYQVVYRLFTLLDLRERAYRSYRRRPFVKGAGGQKDANPQASLMLRMDQEIRLIGQDIGLTPAAQLRLGLETAKAAEKLDNLERVWQAEEVPEGADPRLKAL